ncbi:MAG: adenosylcobinamide-GDP ribazoletransferase [Chlorobiaceae bacterium]|nr:adenosylcobinamide-GDP ribazoletransferase [Chlorobiaceae bacterium]NTV61620.1 adenosylcobinamide-GDP ribazoletransferase [Chlorobiaceae bacterium]
MSAFVTAIRTLTVFTVPGKESGKFSDSLYWFPVVGLLLGCLQASGAYLVSLGGWNELASAVAVSCGYLFTRAIHADGLADVADGFWGGRTKDDALRIMKDSSVGAFGVIALCVVLLFKWIAVLKLVDAGSFNGIASGVLLARWVQVMLASSLSYARREGGTANSFVDGAGWPHLLVSSLLTSVLIFFLFRDNIVHAVILVIAAAAAALLTGLKSYRKIGGVTGDVLGAGSELAEVFVWVTAALLSFQPFCFQG